MNFSIVTGLVLGGLVLIMSTLSMQNHLIFLNAHAALIVAGGTLAAALVSFPFSRIMNMAAVFLSAITGKKRAETERIIQEIVQLAEIMSKGGKLADELPNVKDSFLHEALELVDQGSLSNEELDEVLVKRVEIQNEVYRRDGLTFKTIGKFPPAFGLIGTSLGMVSLLQGMGQPNAFEQIGPAMSIALVATLYGLILSNLILIPFGENLMRASEEDLLKRRIIVDGVGLLRKRRHPLLVEEFLKSYLAPSKRQTEKEAA